MKTQQILRILSVLCVLFFTPLVAGAKEYKEMAREELRNSFYKELSRTDKDQKIHDRINNILFVYRSIRIEWLVDLEEYYIKEYLTIRNKLDKTGHNTSLSFMGRIRQYLEESRIKSKKFQRLLLEDLPRTQPYIFPKQNLIGGWPLGGGYDQRKGIRGQLMSSIVLTDDGSFTRKLVAELKANQFKNINDRYMAIWSLGYASQEYATESLKKLLSSKDKKEKFLVESALNMSLTFKKDKQKKELDAYLKQKKIRRNVLANEYHPH